MRAPTNSETTMKDSEKRQAAKAFAAYWQDKGDEKQETQLFWGTLLTKVLGVTDVEKHISFELPVKIDHTSYIDAYIESTRVLIEQKSKDIDLAKPALQSDGTHLTPFQQARRYAGYLPFNQTPRWIIVSNFRAFHIHDMNKPNAAPEVINLCDLPKEYHRLDFIIKERDELLHHEEEVSIKAGLIVGKLYDALLKQYRDPENEETLRSLNKLCVRLVFCLYAEDAGIFQSRLAFHNYISRFEPRDIRRALIDLFEVLDTKPADRDPYLDDSLTAFPYVNGGLFAMGSAASCRANMGGGASGLTNNNNNTVRQDASPPIEISNFTEEIKQLLLRNASEDFDWSSISPTIFGAVFESTLNPETRRKGGMHYTSIENIHKVIDPLFLDNLRAELEEIRQIKNGKQRKDNAEKYINRLANLTFLDPACGSGNFLTETYISLRRLENEALRIIYEEEKLLDLGGIIKVNINQFYGIEINDFAVTVAKTALWIAESQMLKETEDIVHTAIDFLPLKSYSGIVEGNALRLDWAKVVASAKMGGDTLGGDASCVGKNEHNNNAPGIRTSQADAGSVAPQSVIPKKLNYIMGNPPFVGYSLQSKEQKDDILSLYIDEKGKPYKTAGKIDYVAGWYWKAAELMQGTTIRAALVSTNSITQGEQVAAVWKPLYDRFGVQIDFAHRTFRWDSEASDKAHVHCVIIGFSVGGGASCLTNKIGGGASGLTTNNNNNTVRQDASPPNPPPIAPPIIYDGDKKTIAKNISPYLIDAPNVLLESRNKPIADVPQMSSGGKPVEGGFLIFTEQEKIDFLKIEPNAENYFRPFMGSEDFISGKGRWCLWLCDVSPKDLRAMPKVMERVENVRQFRLDSVKAATREYAKYPTRFMEIKQPDSDYLMIPATSSENRTYVPIGYLDKNVIASNAASFVPNATLYHFGILTSSVHMAWMRAVCGRLEMRYRYSINIVYNNFPWPMGGDASSVGNDKTKLEISKYRNLEITKSRNYEITENVSQKLTTKISHTAQSILDARALYPDSSLADLYDPLTMPPELRRAHQVNDRAVLEAYGLPKDITEPEIVAHLMALYRQLTAKEK